MKQHIMIAAALMAATNACLAQGDSVQLFGPGAISRPDSNESFGSISPNGREFYYTIHRADFGGQRIVVARLEGARWSAPQTLPFSGRWNDREPKLSPDGRRLYFSSNRPLVATDTVRRGNLDLWMAERGADSTWGAAHHIEGPVNGDGQDFCPVVAASGTLYFISTRAGGPVRPSDGRSNTVWRARALDRTGLKFGAPEILGPAINSGFETNVYVTPDERTMIVSRDGAPDGLGGDDLYASAFVDRAWQPMRHLPAPINTDKYEYGPSVSPDGKWLFFTSARAGTPDVYRVGIGAIEGDGVRRAALDYLEGFYEGDTAKLVRSLRPELFKYGYWREKDSTTYAGEKMTYPEALAYAARFRAQKRTTPAGAPQDVILLDVQDQSASVKVRAWWGTDYLLLGKYDGRWMILHVMWQGP